MVPSRLLSGAGAWKSPKDGAVTSWGGKQLGYLDHLGAMIEYVIKYKQGMKDGLKKQITCLRGRLEEDEVALQEPSDTGTVEGDNLDQTSKQTNCLF